MKDTFKNTDKTDAEKKDGERLFTWTKKGGMLLN